MTNSKIINKTIEERGVRPFEQTMDNCNKIFSQENDSENLMDPNYDYKWVRFHCGGENDYHLEDAQNQGWELIEKEKVKNAKHYQDPLNRDEITQKYLRKKDTLLMKRPKIFGENERKEYQKKDEEQKAKLFMQGIAEYDY